MATRPPTLVRSALFLAVLVVALTVAPAVEALSARAGVRASAKVDPEADPSSLLPAWPTGADDPCVYVIGPQGDTGTLLKQNCKSYVCIQRVVMIVTWACIVEMEPEAGQLQFQVLSSPISLAGWKMAAHARDADGFDVVRCPEWIGPGSPVPPAPVSLPPCNVSIPWNGTSIVGLVFDVPAGSAALGVLSVYIGPPIW